MSVDTWAIKRDADHMDLPRAVHHVKGLCDEVDRLSTEVAWLRAGEDPAPVPENAQPRPGQWLAYLHSLSRDARIMQLEGVRELVDDGHRCLTENHRGRIADVGRLLAAIARVEALHRPRIIQVPESDACADYETACEHDDGNCPEVDLTVCGECDEIRGLANDEHPVSPWPCGTARALAGGE